MGSWLKLSPANKRASRAPAAAGLAVGAHRQQPRADKHGVDLISDALPYSPLWYREPNGISNAIGYAEHRSRSHDAVIRVYDEAGNVIGTHEHASDFKEPWPLENTISDLLIELAQAIQVYKKCEAGWNGRRSKQLTGSCVCAGFRCSSSRSFF
jgi:hypothetical protein